MTRLTRSGWLTLVLLSGAGQVACNPREPGTDDTAPAPVDSAPPPGTSIDTATTPDTGVATPPITPSQSSIPRDTPPSTAQQPESAQVSPRQEGQAQGQVSQAEYEGWRQYSVQCARCHGQDVLPNPVAANLLVSAGPGGPVSTQEKFVQVVSEGRPERGMPAFKSIMSPEQIQAVYAYVKARADKRIPPGRPAQPAG
jgi:mono/diheme cytochrome c family protein